MSELYEESIDEKTMISYDDIKKINKDFFTFLEKNQVYGDNAPYTHTSFGKPFGKYFIDGRLEYEKFLILYKRILDAGVMEHGGLYMTEKQKKVGPMCIDYDFRFEEKKRQYTTKNIFDITTVYMNLVKKYIEIPESEELRAFVTEKERPTFDKNYKDGFHIMIPLPFDVSVRFLIHDEAKEIIKKEDILKDLPFVNTIDDIIDDSVVIRNGWMMYGSKKKDKLPYILTHVYDEDMKEIDRKTFSRDELAVLLSLRRYDEGDELELKEEHDNDEMREYIHSIYNKYNGSKKKKENVIRQELIIDNIRTKYNNTAAINKDTEIARRLMGILSPARAVRYDDWSVVGWTAHNIDLSLYDAFVEFSRKSTEKFDERGCHRLWNSAKVDGYSIASLHYWAKQDDPEKYQEIMNEQISKQIEKTGAGTHDDIAKILFEMYCHEYKCVSISKKKWLAYYNNKWNTVEHAYTLANIISDELAPKLFKLASASKQKNGDMSLKTFHELASIAKKFGTESFKNQIISSAGNRFYDNKFEENLNSNPNLLGFENGVYDLENGIFREGVPEDMITITTGYDYNPEYSLDSPEIKEIIKYFEEVMADDDMREYTLMSFACFLDGHIRQQTFRILTGSGGNGKSQTLDLIKEAMGGYFGTLPTGILTRKRGASSNATPELADKKGKRLLVIQEPEYDDVVYVGQMKNLTGADTIPCRALYGDPFEYKPQFKLILICNKLPTMPFDGGVRRRVRIVPFESEFVDTPDPRKVRQFKKDPKLPEKMKNWKQAFMWLLLNVYYKKYRESGYMIMEPTKVTLRTDKYERDSDKYLEFLNEYIVHTDEPEDTIQVPSLYNDFKSWHSEVGYGRGIPTRNEFVNHIKTSKNIDVDGGVFIGVCYKDDYDEKMKRKAKDDLKKKKKHIIKETKKDSDDEASINDIFDEESSV